MLANTTQFSDLQHAALFVGQDSSPAADVHVGLFVARIRLIPSQKEQVLEDPRRPGVCPTTAAAFVCWEDQVASGGMAIKRSDMPATLCIRFSVSASLNKIRCSPLGRSVGIFNVKLRSSRSPR